MRSATDIPLVVPVRTCIICNRSHGVVIPRQGFQTTPFWAIWEANGTWGLCLHCAQQDVPPELLQETIESRHV